MHREFPYSVSKWYVLYTAARAEKQVEQRLKKNGIEVWLPLHLAPRRWSDRIKYVEMPLFSSYVFVKTTDHVLRTLVTAPGVSRIVFYNGSPAVIKEQEITAIKSFLEQAKSRELSFAIDDDVLIACGPLKDISGKIKKIGKTKILLHLEQLATTVSVSLDQVLKK